MKKHDWIWWVQVVLAIVCFLLIIAFMRGVETEQIALPTPTPHPWAVRLP